MQFRRRTQLLTVSLVVVIAAIGGGLWSTGRLPFADKAVALNGTAYDPDTPAPSFTLERSGNRQVQLSDFQGKVVLLYFGYTYCPDICPTTLATLARAREALGADASKVQVVMITVDPERDTPDRVGSYVQNFDPSFVGLSGTLDQIKPVASAYGIFFQAEPATGASGYAVDHTAAVIAVDPQGKLGILESYGLTSDQIASDIRSLLR